MVWASIDQTPCAWLIVASSDLPTPYIELACLDTAEGNLIIWLSQQVSKTSQYLILILTSYPIFILSERAFGQDAEQASSWLPSRTRGETTHPCRNSLQTLLSFSIALLRAASLDFGIFCRIYLCEWGSIVRPVLGTGPICINCPHLTQLYCVNFSLIILLC